MTDEELDQVHAALVAAHVYMLHLPGRMFVAGNEGHSGKHYCFACLALSGQNHREDCEVVALVQQLGAARNVATRYWRQRVLTPPKT